MKYAWREGMSEISGLGGAYEEACRDMVRAGMEWLDAHPASDPKFHGYKSVFGVIEEDNADAKALSEAVSNAPLVQAKGGPTGAMYQAVITTCLFIRKNGWETYCRKLSKLKDKD